MQEQAEAAPSSRPVLVMLVGAPGTGKSYLGRLLASALKATVVASDVTRKRLFRRRRYTPQEHAVVFRATHRQLQEALASGSNVVFDATNLIESNRGEVYRLAEEAGAKLLIVWTYAPEAVVAQRMLGREAGRDPLDASEASWPVYALLRGRVDPIPRPHFVVNTAVSLEPALKRLIAAGVTGP